MRNWRKTYKILAVLTFAFLVWLMIMAATTPRGVFKSDYSTLLYADGGTLLNAHIAKDGQWRFPPSDTISEKFKQAIINYEDRWFYYHPGINPVSLVKAAVLNAKSGRIVSGGSTLTMQVSRISSGERERTYLRKFIELNRALYIEVVYSKDEILNMYASHAPFGGNVVGIEAASWRYFSRPSTSLSWAEAAMLAVLPNSPSLIHLSRNRDALKAKRDRLLETLYKRGVIDETDYSLAIDEPLPESPQPLPQKAPHLASTMLKKHKGERIDTHINVRLQNTLQDLADQYAREYTLLNNVHNVAILVQETKTGNVIAYIGNASYSANERFCNSVDMITAPRSTGSILKPVLYAAMMTDGIILPHTLIKDVPLYLNGFNPQNFNKGYSGAVGANEAIIRSLNVPLVRMLREYGIDRFLKLLRSLGITTMNRDADHYGASLILGGAEATLGDLCGMYATLVNELADDNAQSTLHNSINKSSIWFMFEAMSKLNRPEEEAEWQNFESMKQIAWKTGTSYGGKDAWAIGMNPDYVVGVWVGNATGEGRAGITGVGYAAPIMLRTFSFLPSNRWFEMPDSDMAEEVICRKSGHRATEYCTEVDTVPIPRSGINTPLCPYHKLVHLNKARTFRVNSSCTDINNIISEPWFVLPPTVEFYYRKTHLDFIPLPPLMEGCQEEGTTLLDIIYPESGSKVYLPKNFEKKRQLMVCEATHINSNAILYWHLDNDYVGQTQFIHNMALQPGTGDHTLTIVDENGSKKSVRFTVVDKD